MSPLSSNASARFEPFRLLVVALFLSLASCFPYPIVVAPQDSGNADAGDGANPDAQAPGTYTLVLGLLNFSRGEWGANLDNVISDPANAVGCDKMDFPALSYPQGCSMCNGMVPGEPGVDNESVAFFSALTGLGLMDPKGSWELQATRGTYLLGLKITNLDDFQNDTDFQAEMSLVVPNYNDNCANRRGRPFVRWDRGTTRNSIVSGTGLLVGGVGTIDFGRSNVLWYPVKLVDGKIFDVPLRGLRLKFYISDSAPATGGLLAARVNVSELFVSLTTAGTPNLGLLGATVRPALASVPDLRVGTECGFPDPSDSTNSADISLGMIAEFTNAPILSTTVTTPAAQSCANQ